MLDEPTAGLDPVASGVLKAKILRARQAGIVGHPGLARAERAARSWWTTWSSCSTAGSSSRARSGSSREATGESRLERAIASLMRRRAA